MSSGITFSGFNDIDFGVVLNAIMTQESVPLTNLQKKQTTLKSQVTNLGTLSTRLTALQDAAAALSTTDSATPFKGTTSDATAVGISVGSGSVAGRYEIVVNELARAQVTATANAAPDADTTTVATGGSITIGTETITIGSAMTLRQLSDAINANADSPARAAVVQSGTNSFKLVLTAKSTGQDNAFTVVDNLTGGGFDLAFTDFDNDGTIGNSVADNAVQATDADLLINNIPVTSSSNTLDAAIPGATVTLLKQDTGSIVVDVSRPVGRLTAIGLPAFVATRARCRAAASCEPSSAARSAYSRLVMTRSGAMGAVLAIVAAGLTAALSTVTRRRVIPHPLRRRPAAVDGGTLRRCGAAARSGAARPGDVRAAGTPGRAWTG